MRIELVNDVEVVISVELVRGQNAVFVAGLEKRDRNHQGAGELEGVGLGENEVVRHIEGLHRERANSRSMAPSKDRNWNAITARAKLVERRQLASRPQRGLIGGEPKPVQDAIA